MKRAILGAIALLSVAMLATPARAGDLNPPGAPAPTMKSLDDIPGSWHRVLPAAERFKLMMGDAAVLDRETGLVWARGAVTVSGSGWGGATSRCLSSMTGGRGGWRLPAIQELSSLLEPNPTGLGMSLPAGHPFNPAPTNVWSGTRSSEPGTRYSRGPILGAPLMFDARSETTQDLEVLCVRGSSGLDAQ